MQAGHAFVVVLVGAASFAQSVPSSCPADRPVDDIVTEIHKEQSKRKHRNADPSLKVICSWGWCIDTSRTPPTFPEPGPQLQSPDNLNANTNATDSNTKSVDVCDTAMKTALAAAHNVEVGDQYFAQKSYDAALSRYRDAREQKPGDVAIHVRMGRVLERLGQLSQAIEEYKAAQKMPGPQKWTDEAKASLLRLQHGPSS